MNQGKGRCLAVLLAMLMMISLVASSAHAVTSTKPADFKDVAKTKWYYDYVMSLADTGIVKGYGDTGEFRPMAPVTREQAAKMVSLAAQLDIYGQKADFSDVDAQGESSPYIAALVNKGAVQGFSDGSFRPQDKVKRADAAKMIQIAFGLELSSMEVKIIDLPSTDANLAKAIEILASNGVVKGYGKSHAFKPDQEINRAEFAKMLCMATAAASVQNAEDMGTYFTIGQAQAQVDRLSKTQDADSKAFLQERLDIFAGLVNAAEPSDREKVQEDIEWLREYMSQCHGLQRYFTIPQIKLPEHGARHGSDILWDEVRTGAGPGARAAYKTEDGQYLVIELGQRPTTPGYYAKTSTIVAHVQNDGWFASVMFSIFTKTSYDLPYYEWEVIWHY